MAERRKVTLQRGVGLGAVGAVVLGNVSMAVFVALGVVADRALGATPLVFAATGIIVLLTLFAYLEGIAMIPQAGGAAGFARRGFGELVSFFVGWALLLDQLILVVLTAFISVHYVGSLPGLAWMRSDPADGILSAAAIMVVAVLSMGGVRTGIRLRIVVMGAAVLAQLALAAIGFALVFDTQLLSSQLELGVTPTWSALLFSAPIAMIGFTGLDTVANLGGELEHPGTDVPRPLIWSAVTSILVFVLVSMVALSAQPVQGSGPAAQTPLGQVSGWVDRPVIGIIEGLGMSDGVTQALRVVFALLAAVVLLIVASGAISGMSRATYFMAEHGQAPSMLVRVDPRTGVPRRGLLILTGVALVLLGVTVSFADGAVVLAQLYAFGATLGASLACLAIVRLRWISPELERPFLAPGNVRVRGRLVSVPMLLGAAGATALWVLVIATHPEARFFGLAWMLFGFVAYGTYRLTHGLPLARLAAARTPTQVRIDAAGYRRILIAVRPEPGRTYDAVDAELVGLAHKLLDVDEPDAEVTVLFVHELPLVEPLDAPLGQVEEQTDLRLAAIRDAAATLDLSVGGSMLRARAAGRTICLEAVSRSCDVVLLVTGRRRAHRDVVLGRCTAYVMRNAPCDVVVMSMPMELTARAGRVAASTAGK